jgi:GDP-L-fucose synthase
MESDNEKVILVTGASGFLGQHVVNLLNNRNDCKVIPASSKDCNLIDLKETFEYINKVNPDIIIHLAARLGGIGDNKKNPSKYFYENMTIGMNVLKCASELGIVRVINIGTVCSYPKYSPVPFSEENIWHGFPEITNASYGIAKRALLEYSRALQNELDFTCINLLLANLYGPGDDFREETSHVIPALIKKMVSGSSNIEVWGDGSPTRDFLYVEDAADAIVRVAFADKDLYSDTAIYNVGTGQETSINELILQLRDICDYQGAIHFDESKPNGQPRRLLDISKFENSYGKMQKTKLSSGLERTYIYYMENRVIINNLEKKFKND